MWQFFLKFEKQPIVPDFIECLLNVQEYTRAVEFLLKGFSYVFTYSMHLFDCAMTYSKSKLVVWYDLIFN